MPEGLEAELYRRAADRTVGRTIESVMIDDRQPEAAAFRAMLPGHSVTGTRRHGKLVIVDTDGPAIGLHFGMTGRLIVDDVAAIDELAYGARRDDPAWNRLVLTFTDGTTMRVNDPRRWATFTLMPETDALGPDLMDVTTEQLVARLQKRRVPVKAALLDQRLVAGLGNLLIDELLWVVGINPTRPANSLTSDEVSKLVDAMRERLPLMLAAGGSHTGTINPDVRAGVPVCPRDGAALRRDEVGGRTTVWCPTHQI